MNTYITEIQAKDPKTGKVILYSGPKVKGITFTDAQVYCNNNGLGYCKVVGRLIAEGELRQGEEVPGFEKYVDPILN